MISLTLSLSPGASSIFDDLFGCCWREREKYMTKMVVKFEREGVVVIWCKPSFKWFCCDQYSLKYLRVGSYCTQFKSRHSWEYSYLKPLSMLRSYYFFLLKKTSCSLRNTYPSILGGILASFCLWKYVICTLLHAPQRTQGEVKE